MASSVPRELAPVTRPVCTEGETNKGVCAFCQCSDVDSEIVGETLQKGDLVVHQFCLYFSSALYPRLSQDKGLMGYSVSDIRKELIRGRRKCGKKKLHGLCCYGCGKPDYFVGCAVTRCRKAGHFTCLYKAGFLFQYFDKFHAFCPRHRPRQKPLLNNSSSSNSSSTPCCCICLLDLSMETIPSFYVMYCPCCYHTFHRDCIQKQARSAGLHFFRCPICNNRKKFLREMKIMGIEVPNRDASWEIAGNYYDYSPDYVCRMELCISQEGREHFSSKSSAVRCLYCDQCIGHDVCVKANEACLIREGKEFVCTDCAPVVMETRKEVIVISDSEEEEEDDVKVHGEGFEDTMACKDEKDFMEEWAITEEDYDAETDGECEEEEEEEKKEDVMDDILVSCLKKSPDFDDNKCGLVKCCSYRHHRTSSIKYSNKLFNCSNCSRQIGHYLCIHTAIKQEKFPQKFRVNHTCFVCSKRCLLAATTEKRPR